MNANRPQPFLPRELRSRILGWSWLVAQRGSAEARYDGGVPHLDRGLLGFAVRHDLGNLSLSRPAIAAMMPGEDRPTAQAGGADSEFREAMTTSDRRSHWQQVYLSKGEQEVSWSQPKPQPSLGLIEKFSKDSSATIVDIGGGASRLVDALVKGGFGDITVLDLSETA